MTSNARGSKYEILYYFVQFGQGGTGGQAGRNLDVGHPERGISQISAKIKSSAILVTCDVELTRVIGDLAKAMDFE